MNYYFDTEEGPAKETSHPKFVKSMNSNFYYDCMDEFSPFGNDDGADLLYNLEDWYREDQQFPNIVNWMFNHIDEMGFEYQSKGCAEISDIETLNKIQKEDEFLISTMDNSIIATGFGQIKITGKIDSHLKDITVKALERHLLLNKGSEDGFINQLKKMKHDLINFE